MPFLFVSTGFFRLWWIPSLLPLPATSPDKSGQALPLDNGSGT
jgi:hypothetical protein